MIIDAPQSFQTQSQDPHISTQPQEYLGERLPLKSSAPIVDSDGGHNLNASQHPPPYALPNSSRTYSTINYPYFNPISFPFQGPNPNPQPFKRFIKATLFAYLCCIAWAIFVETVGVLVRIDIGTRWRERHPDGQHLTSAGRYTSMDLGERGRSYFSSLNNAWSDRTQLPSPPHTESHLRTRPLPIQYPPSFSWASPPISHSSETLAA